MSKAHICSNIHKASLAHSEWVRRTGHLIEGLPVSAEAIPFDATECRFGTWFYDEVMKFKIEPDLHDVLAEIENIHNRAHDIYRRIHKIYFVDAKPSWIKSLVSNHRKNVTKEMREAALHYYDELQRVSEKLMSQMELLETRVQAATSRYFSELAK